MRPVNLIPPEDRRGDRAPLRAGPLSYAIVGALAAVLLGVVMVVTTGNTIADRESQVEQLTADRDTAQAQATTLKPYADFAALRAGREVTISSLAQSRFDWERVMHELAIVLPKDVWLTSLSGTVAPDAGGEIKENTLRADIPGPALSLVGCGASHEAVARFVSALEDIDGVTRVGLAKSERPTTNLASASGSDDCRTRDFIARFEIVAAFDAVPTPADAIAAAAAGGAAAVPGAAGTPTATTTSAPAANDGGVADEQSSAQKQRNDVAQSSERAHKAVNLIPGAAR